VPPQDPFMVDPPNAHLVHDLIAKTALGVPPDGRCGRDAPDRRLPGGRKLTWKTVLAGRTRP